MKRFFVILATVVLAATTMTVGPTEAAKPRQFFVDEEKLPFDALPGATAYWGVRSGAGYQMEVPANWNGDLVVYAHGYAGEDLELFVQQPPLRAWFISQGYAWAASSYSSNGYVPGQGAKDTHALIAQFTGEVERPDRVFATGFSMGGHVIGVALEQWPNSFDGAVPLCGVMGDSELFDYFLDTYVLAEHFAGNDASLPQPDDYYDSGQHISTFAALGFFGPALTTAGEAYSDALAQATGGTRPVFDIQNGGTGSAFFPFAFESAGAGAGERENDDTVYQLDIDPALSAAEVELNEAVPRIDALPRTRRPNGLGGFPGSENDSPRINGTMTVPTLSMHTLGDLFVPFNMQQIYAERVAANGNDDLLITRAIRAVGHCDFTGAELVESFSDMVEWVDTGVKPTGDPILDPVAVADPDFGCAFTRNTRGGVDPCP